MVTLPLAFGRQLVMPGEGTRLNVNALFGITLLVAALLVLLLLTELARADGSPAQALNAARAMTTIAARAKPLSHWVGNFNIGFGSFLVFGICLHICREVDQDGSMPSLVYCSVYSMTSLASRGYLLHR